MTFFYFLEIRQGNRIDKNEFFIGKTHIKGAEWYDRFIIRFGQKSINMLMNKKNELSGQLFSIMEAGGDI
jgi:hypothetical protein